MNETVFNAFDLLHIALFAERQRCVKRHSGIRSRKYDKNKTEFELHYVGAMGEFAIGKEYPAALDYDIYPIGDDGVDIVLWGHDCQVKTFAFNRKGIDFFIDNMDEFKAPVAIGVQILSSIRVRIMGCISKQRFQKISTEKDYGYGPRLMVPEGELKDLSVLQKSELPRPLPPKIEGDEPINDELERQLDNFDIPF
jgi:hypothetical protein